MPRRPATVTQADVARSIRAVIAAGLKVIRVVTRPDGVSIETVDVPPVDPPVEPKTIVL
jgi:hypothetical protein